MDKKYKINDLYILRISKVLERTPAGWDTEGLVKSERVANKLFFAIKYFDRNEYKDFFKLVTRDISVYADVQYVKHVGDYFARQVDAASLILKDLDVKKIRLSVLKQVEQGFEQELEKLQKEEDSKNKEIETEE